MDKLHVPWAVEGLPALIHLSLFLFFSGLLIFLFNIHHRVFFWVIWWIGIFVTVYGLITVMPIFRHDSPYYAPLSGSVWFLYTSIPYAFFKILTYLAYLNCFTAPTYFRFRNLRRHYYRRILGGVEKAAEETASKQSSVIDFRILDWTLGTLGEDDLLEKFFDAIPGFIKSSLVDGLKQNYRYEFGRSFNWPLAGFLRRTLTSNSIPDSVKSRRLIICIDAADAMNVSNAISNILFVVDEEYSSLPQPIETAQALARWCTSNDPFITNHTRRIVARILMDVRERDDHWIVLAKDQFGLPEHVLRDNITHGDNSVLLSILIHVTRQAIRSHYSYHPWLLSPVSRFDVRLTIPGLQHEFCDMWNEIVLEARKQGYASNPVLLLRAIRQAYIDLHRNTEAAATAFSASADHYVLLWPSSYPLCTLASHRSDGPHPIQRETQPVPANTAVAEISVISSEANVITPSPTDLIITRSQPFLSTSPSTESTPVPIEVSHELPQSAPSATEFAVSTEPETSHTAAATSLTLLHPDPILATVTPSAVVSGLGDVSNAFQRTTLAATLSHLQEINDGHDTAIPSATTCISEISSMAPSIATAGTALERDEEATGVPPAVVSRSQSSPVLAPAPASDVIPEEQPSFIEYPLIRSDSTTHALGSPSSSATARSRIALQVTSILDAHATSSIRAVGGHDDTTRGMDTPIPMEDLPHPSQSTAPAPGIDPVTLPPEDHDNGRNWLYR
ncbi:hypothetical protein BJV74DRAFT_465897 [Russula compacta]|nr:hypothetical protein BJV74DRAFT_465897 [Russula compacta]